MRYPMLLIFVWLNYLLSVGAAIGTYVFASTRVPSALAGVLAFLAVLGWMALADLLRLMINAAEDLRDLRDARWAPAPPAPSFVPSAPTPLPAQEYRPERGQAR